MQRRGSVTFQHAEEVQLGWPWEAKEVQCECYNLFAHYVSS